MAIHVIFSSSMIGGFGISQIGRFLRGKNNSYIHKKLALLTLLKINFFIFGCHNPIELGHSLTLGFQTLILFFQKTVGLCETEYNVKAYGSTRKRIYSNGIGHMTQIATTLMYGKNP